MVSQVFQRTESDHRVGYCRFNGIGNITTPCATESKLSCRPPIHKFAIVLFLSCTLVTGCASTSKQEGTGEYLDSSVVTANVKAAIAEDSVLHVAQINVATYKGVVQLSGFVDNQSDINRAGALARGIAGVQSVKNDMQLK